MTFELLGPPPLAPRLEIQESGHLEMQEIVNMEVWKSKKIKIIKILNTNIHHVQNVGSVLISKKEIVLIIFGTFLDSFPWTKTNTHSVFCRFSLVF